MTRVAILIACAVPLAACSSEPEVTARNASVAEVANKVAEAGGSGAFVRPGKWQSTVTVEKMEVPGMTPEMAERMKTMMADRHAAGTETCLTPEDVKRPKEGFFAGDNKTCRYDRFTMADGKIDAQMTCAQDGAGQKMVMTGTYGPNDYAMRMSMAATGAAAERGMDMTMRVEARRIGECDARTA